MTKNEKSEEKKTLYKDIEIKELADANPEKIASTTQDIRGLASTLQFYKQLKYRLSVADDELSKGRYKFHKKWLSPLKPIFLITYILVIPFLEVPHWCLIAHEEREDFNRGTVIYNCDNLGLPYSHVTSLSPVFTSFMDLICLAFFIGFRRYKYMWMSERRKKGWRDRILVICCVLIIIDNIVSIIWLVRSFIGSALRPVIFGSFLHLVRVNIRQFYHDLKDSAVILIVIFFFILTWAVIAHFLFRYNFEGYDYFESIPDANWNMIVMMTTANFPDVMLPAYEQNFWVSLFFVSYLILGLYFLMNFLLANVFNNFKDRLELQHDTVMRQTEELVTEMFNRFDYTKTGLLNQ